MLLAKRSATPRAAGTIVADVKIARRETDAGPRCAVLDDSGDLVDLPDGDLINFIAIEGRLPEVAAAALRSRAVVTPLSSARLLAPLEPPTVRDFSTFPEHSRGVIKMTHPNATLAPESFEIPTFYFSNPYATVGPHADVPVPPGCVDFD